MAGKMIPTELDEVVQYAEILSSCELCVSILEPLGSEVTTLHDLFADRLVFVDKRQINVVRISCAIVGSGRPLGDCCASILVFLCLA